MRAVRLHVARDGTVVMTSVLPDGVLARVVGKRAPRGPERDQIMREVAQEMLYLRREWVRQKALSAARKRASTLDKRLREGRAA